MPAQGIERFGADVVLDAAGILEGGLLVDPQPDENLCQAIVAVVGLLSNPLSFWGERDALVGIQLQVTVSGKALDLLADSWAGEMHVMGDIDGAHSPILFLKDEDRLEVHLGGFLTVHGLTHFQLLRKPLRF